MRQENIDLVHSFTIKAVVYGSLAARLAGVPARVNEVAGLGYVFTSGDVMASVLRPFVRRLMSLALGGRNALTVVQNPDDAAVIQQTLNVPPSQIRLIPGSGVNCRRFVPPEAQSNVALDRQYHLRVLLPARMLWDKGISEFVDSARILASQGRSIEFLLAGEPDTGNPASIPISTLQSWRDEGCVNWLGHVDDMPALFRSVDIVVLPSYREGLPKGLIEAAAAERALIATDVPGCREVVQHEQTGLLVPVKNAHALAAAIARLHEEPALRRQIGKAARVRALAVFDESHILRQTLSAYYELTRKGLDCPVERHE